MKITNTYGLPKPFVDAVSKEYTPTPNRYSVTTILKDNREILLSRRHGDEIEQDVSDMIWAIFGSAVHKVLETSGEQNELLKEFFMSAEVIDGYTLSGICDVYDTANEEVIDYKVVSTFKCLKGDFTDFRKQGLLYCWLLRRGGFRANKATFYMILRDWQGSKARFDASYPQHQVQKVTFEYSGNDFDDCGKWIIEKFESLKRDEFLPDDDIAVCSPESRWRTQTVFAVMKNGRKTALKLCTTADEAQEECRARGGNYIEVRQGTDRKCAEYCSCAKFCEYYQKQYGGSEE